MGDRNGQAGAWGGGPGGYNGINPGARWTEGQVGQWDPAAAERTYRETMRDLGRLRENVGQNPEIARDVTDLVREMGRIDPARFGDDPLLAARINSQIVAGLEQIELQLRRKVEEQEGGNVRSGASEPAPAGYSKSVAEYYKKLSDKQTK
jgi:hypothetical protein